MYPQIGLLQCVVFGSAVKAAQCRIAGYRLAEWARLSTFDLLHKLLLRLMGAVQGAALKL